MRTIVLFFLFISTLFFSCRTKLQNCIDGGLSVHCKLSNTNDTVIWIQYQKETGFEKELAKDTLIFLQNEDSTNWIFNDTLRLGISSRQDDIYNDGFLFSSCNHYLKINQKEYWFKDLTIAPKTRRVGASCHKLYCFNPVIIFTLNQKVFQIKENQSYFLE